MRKIDKLCVVILNYNDSCTTKKLINSIGDYRSVDKIVIVDNCSTDDSFEELKNLKNNKIDIIRTEENRGYGYGNNFGIKYAIDNYKPDLLLISNPDIVVSEETIINMKAVLAGENSHCVVPCIRDINGNESVSAWKLPNILNDVILNSLILSKIFKKNLTYSKSELHRKSNIVEVVCGCFFMIKSEVMEKVKYFDNDTFLYCEERILAKKLKDNNYKSILLNEYYCTHEHSVSINKSISSKVKKFRILNKSKEIYYYKYFNIGIFKKIILKISYIEGLIERIIYEVIKRR